MVEEIKDLEIFDFDRKSPEFWNKIDSTLKEKIGLGLSELKAPLCAYILSHAEELTLELPNIAPNGKYDKLLEDNEGMASFLKEEASKPELWELNAVKNAPEPHKNLLAFIFSCKAVNDGETLEGLVFVSKTGIIRHSFVQVDI